MKPNLLRVPLLAGLLASAAGRLGADWPQFRGPGGTGVSESAQPPESLAPDRLSRWRTPLPAGNSSPVVSGKGIFLINDLRDVKDWKKANLPVKKKEPDPFAKPKKVKAVKEGDELLPDGAAAAGGGADQKKELEPYIVQRYLEDPYLVGSKKFDMRIYVLVTSYSPLTVWLYRSGFARFSGVRYSVDEKSLAAHATNVAVQKTAAGYDPETGCKWMLHSLKAFLISRHGCEAATPNILTAFLYQK
jgi:hypothetical protein